MIRLIWVLLIVYVIGIGVQLAPTVREAWDTVPSSQLVSRVVSELPAAAAWPMRVYESVRGKIQSTPASAPAPAPAGAPAPAPSNTNSY